MEFKQIPHQAGGLLYGLKCSQVLRHQATKSLTMSDNFAIFSVLYAI